VDPLAAAVLGSWRFDLPLTLGLSVAALVYVRGWCKLHRELPSRYNTERITSFLAGLLLVLLALESPLDAFAGFLLQVHMVQHLLLIMVAPPLIWFGQPVIPLLRGLPGSLLRDGLGPFLRWHALRRAGRALTHPIVCWLAMTSAIVFWHMPRWYDLGLGSPAWHMVEHMSFLSAALLFWWPVVGVWPARPRWPRPALILYLVLADVVNTALSAWLVFSSHVVYRTYSLVPRLGGISALSDQSTAGMLMWVPGSIAYLIPAFVITMRAFGGSSEKRPRLARSPQPVKTPWNLPRYRHLRRIPQAILLILAVAVIADGFFGPQIAPLNLAGVLPWTFWRGLAVIGLLAAGNLFCMACPFMLVRDAARNWLPRWFPARHRWPAGLRSKWLAAGLVAVYLWAYDAFSLWNSPWWTAWIAVGYFTVALAIDGWFQGAVFCKYLCPIGQFHFVNSFVSPLEVGVRSKAVCDSCTTHDCLRGNATARGCELQLFQPTKAGNFDCTFCLDCVHACPHENVAIVPARTPEPRRRPDIAALGLILVFGAFLNAAAMTGPAMQWIHSLHAQLGSMTGATTIFYLAGWLAIALVLLIACRSKERFYGAAFALIPLGFSMWAAHFIYHLTVGWRSLEPVFGRFFHVTVLFTAAPPPDWLRGMQLLLLDGGLVWALYLAWRARSRSLTSMGLAVALYAIGVWILFQPMEMRGLMPV
jgi:cytochrome c oxidase assembly factor CtaG